jgi:hypothetical protein
MPSMTKEELVQKVKGVMALWKDSKFDDAYKAFGALFAEAGFSKNRPEDQRQALKLMIHARNAPKPTPASVDAHKAAVAPLTELVSSHNEPADYEMLGMCHELIGNAESASNMYRAGLNIERERSPSSDLCGALMRRISLI